MHLETIKTLLSDRNLAGRKLLYTKRAVILLNRDIVFTILIHDIFFCLDIGYYIISAHLKHLL
jgi:hypothetical protein